MRQNSPSAWCDTLASLPFHARDSKFFRARTLSHIGVGRWGTPMQRLSKRGPSLKLLPMPVNYKAISGDLAKMPQDATRTDSWPPPSREPSEPPPAPSSGSIAIAQYVDLD